MSGENQQIKQSDSALKQDVSQERGQYIIQILNYRKISFR